MILRLEAWRGVWRVTQNGLFYGDYRTRIEGRDAVTALAHEMRGRGEEVSVEEPR